MLRIKINTKTNPMQFEIMGEPVPFQHGIKLLLMHQNWSRADLAKKLRISPRTIEGWLSKKQIRPPENTIMLIAHIINN